MGGRIFPVDKEALLRRIRGPKVYVDPLRGTVSSIPLSGSIGVPKTTWFSENSTFPLFSVSSLPELIIDEIVEMCRYFPDFDLYYNEGGTFFWLGKIDGIGEIKITYPQTYPAQKFLVEALDLEESFNEELNQVIWSYNGVTPAGALIVLMRFFLLRKVSGG